MIHGRDQIDDVEIAAMRDGSIVGLRVRIVANLGASFQLLTPVIPTLTLLMAPGCYKIKNISGEVIGVFTNTMATDAYRGAGRPEATYLIERAMDLVARKLEMDPVAVRRKNFITPAEFPYTTATGLSYDSGRYETTMDYALSISDYAGLRTEQHEAHRFGRLIGIGLSTYVEVCGMGPSAAMPAAGWDSATIRVEPTGSITVLTGISPHGQGQETTFAQIIADELGVPIDQVTIIHGDTDKVQYGVGTFGSRGTAVGGAAMKLAIDSIQAKAMTIAAHQWEANPADLEYRNGKIQIKGDPSKTMSTAEAGFLAFMGDKLPPGLEPGLDATRRFEPPNFVYPFGTHVCVVEIDPQTGAIELRKYFAVDDCGRLINPMLVEGQIHGGLAQGYLTGALRGGRLRRERPAPHRNADGVRRASRRHAPRLPARTHGDDDRRQSAGRQGRRRSRNDRFNAGDCRSGDRRARAVRGTPSRHAVAARESLECDPAGGGTMIPAIFDYKRAGSLDEALGLLEKHGADAKLLAGGHSLIPMMKLRLATPGVLIDISRIPGLDGMAVAGTMATLGALATHAAIAGNAELDRVRAGTLRCGARDRRFAGPQPRHGRRRLRPRRSVGRLPRDHAGAWGELHDPLENW